MNCQVTFQNVEYNYYIHLLFKITMEYILWYVTNKCLLQITEHLTINSYYEQRQKLLTENF
jgi:hypothetical protein